MRKEFIETGKIVTVHGLKGEVKIQSWSDSPDVLAGLKCLYIKNGTQKFDIVRARVQKNCVIAELEGIDTVEKAEALRNCVVYLRRSDLSLPEGTYFVCDLIGLRVVETATGREYGSLTDVLETGANDVYEITDQSGKTFLIPGIPQVVDKTDIDGGVMSVTMPDGILD